MKFRVIKICFIGLSLFVWFCSCEKQKLNRSTETSLDNNKAENLFEDVFSEVDKVAESYTGKTSANVSISNLLNDNCAVIDVVTTNGDFPKTITLDFGQEYCVGSDGKERKGKIIAQLSGPYRSSGSSITINTDNYFVDFYKVDGTKLVENITTTSGNPRFAIEVSGIITTPESEEIVWNSSRIREWINGWDTRIFNYNDSLQKWVYLGIEGLYDDIWEVTGAADGINRNGIPFAAEITKPLRVQWCDNYREITSGVIELQPEELKLRVIDFGEFQCDNLGTITIEGRRASEFTLRK